MVGIKQLQAEWVADKSEESGRFGPSGFMELGGNSLVVDSGDIYMSETAVGYLYEDGHIINIAGQSEESERTIDDLEGCTFRGVDSRGLELTLVSSEPVGPTGTLFYNQRELKVINGRISTFDHELVGEMTDEGKIAVRDHYTKSPRRELDEAMQMAMYFEGVKSNGTKLRFDFIKPLYRRDKSYGENELIRYFQDFDRLGVQQKKYVWDSMNIWCTSGILQVVRKSEGNAALGNVKHGAAGVTRVRTGMVDLDLEEFDRDIDLFKRFGTLAVIGTRFDPYVEVRVNLVVSHEFGHQLQFCLSQACQERIAELYRARLANSLRNHPAPRGYEGNSELVRQEAVLSRNFISGYARSSKEEYWAESVAAYSIAESRKTLQELDPGICQILKEIILHPEEHFSPVLVESLLDLQASLRMGNAFPEDLLSC